MRALPTLLPALRVTRARRHPAVRGGAAELAVEVVTPVGHKRRLSIDVRATAVPSRVRETIRRLKTGRSRGGGYPVFASSFLSPRVREICRDEGVGYLDLAGNCYLRFDDCYLEKVVEKNPFPARGRPPSLFTPVSSRILRALLEEPRRSWRVSDVARVAQASLGQTSNVTRRLLDEAYAVRRGRHLRLSEPGRLLDAWRDASGAAPRGATHAYYSFEQNAERLLHRIAQVASRDGLHYAATSFAAAALLAPFVHGIGVVQCYLGDRLALDRWVRALDLRPVEAGANLLLIDPYDSGVFYRAQVRDRVTLVGAVQLYLDLSAEPGRGREQAEFLRQERLKF